MAGIWSIISARKARSSAWSCCASAMSCRIDSVKTLERRSSGRNSVRRGNARSLGRTGVARSSCSTIWSLYSWATGPEYPCGYPPPEFNFRDIVRLLFPWPRHAVQSSQLEVLSDIRRLQLFTVDLVQERLTEVRESCGDEVREVRLADCGMPFNMRQQIDQKIDAGRVSHHIAVGINQGHRCQPGGIDMIVFIQRIQDCRAQPGAWPCSGKTSGQVSGDRPAIAIQTVYDRCDEFGGLYFPLQPESFR